MVLLVWFFLFLKFIGEYNLIFVYLQISKENQLVLNTRINKFTTYKFTGHDLFVGTMQNLYVYHHLEVIEFV